MTLELRTVRGPLDDVQLGWVTSLYGPVDPKYGSLEYVRHQFVDNPFGWSVHAFGIDGEDAVAHCCAVPFRARRGTEPLVAGKIEAVVVAEAYRGRRVEGDRSLIVALLQAMYASAHGNGVAILFGLAPPRVARIHERAGCRRVELDAPTYVLVTHPRVAGREWSARRRVGATALSLVQNAVVATAYAAARVAAPGARPRVGELTAADEELAAADEPGEGWTVSGTDAWPWFAGSGVLKAVEIGGRFGSRAIVRLGAAGTAVQVVAWRPERDALPAAVLLLGALRRLARERGAPSLRFQPWSGTSGNGALTRACRLLGFARRAEVEIVLHGVAAAETVELTPFFYVTF